MPADLLLSLNAEFRRVDERRVRAELERLADRFRKARGGAHWFARSTEEQLLKATAGFGSSHDGDPDALLLDSVLARRRSHPVMLAVLAQEAARRAGVALAILGKAHSYVVGDLRFDPAVLVDPARAAPWPSPSAPSELIRRWCPHQVAFGVLAGLAAAYGLSGDLGRAIRAAEPRLALPIAEPVRREVERESHRLKARLN